MLDWSNRLFLHGLLLHKQAVDNVNTIIAPALVGKVGSIYSTVMLLTKEFFTGSS